MTMPEAPTVAPPAPVPAPTVESLVRSFHAPTMALLMEDSPAPLTRVTLGACLGFPVPRFGEPVTTKKAVLDKLVTLGVETLKVDESVIRARLAAYPTPAAKKPEPAVNIYANVVAEVARPAAPRENSHRITFTSDTEIRRAEYSYRPAPDVDLRVPQRVLHRCYAERSISPLEAWACDDQYRQYLFEVLDEHEVRDGEDRPEVQEEVYGDIGGIAVEDLAVVRDLIRDLEGDDEFDFDD